MIETGESSRTGSREILYCLFFMIWLILTGFQGQFPDDVEGWFEDRFNLSIREIARQLNVSHSTVIECLRRLGIHDKGSNKRVRTQGQIPFGYNYRCVGIVWNLK
jgi:hypothetical protein